MKILSLYVDKWYIVGAVMDGANKTPLSLSNAEDRIWLYFYSNNTTNTVKYSLSYKDEALAGENGFYADIFELLPDYKEYHYEKYGACKKMSDIFSDADIFADLRKSYGDGSNVPVYVSFSEDIDLVAREIILKALKDERFDALQYTLPLENLALEYMMRHGKITNDNNVLVVNGCNENLRYSIYNLQQNALSVVSQKCEPGYGVDSRKQAVVEEVMEYMQADTHFLTGAKDEWQEEMLYLSQFANLWLEKIDKTSDTAPVALGNIHFKKQANNEIPVVVSAYNLNDRTKNIIGKLTGKIVDMIRESGILLHQISNIVFLGDVFSNRAFTDSLQQKIGVPSDNVTLISELTLPDIVAVYDKWEKKAFDEEKKKFLETARNKYIQDRKIYVEQQTQDLKRKAQMFEEEGRLQDALEEYEKVLKIDGNDKFSTTRIEAIRYQMEENRKIREQIDCLLEKAHQSFLASDFTDTIRNCDDILRLQNNNIEAKKMKEDAEDVLKRRELLERYIDKMNELIMESRFFDASSILQRVDALNVNDSRMKDIRDKIETGISKLQSQVRDKSLAYEMAFQAGDYQQCQRLCDELLTIGADSSVWTENRQIIIEKTRQNQIFQDNYELARKARLEHEWNKVIEYAGKALAEKNDSELNGWIAEARESLNNEELTRKQEEFNLAFVNEQWNKVVELYNSNEVLHKKCSNSKMYDKAKRVLKSSRTPIPVGKHQINSHEGTKNPQIELTNNDSMHYGNPVHVKKNRPQPTRPIVSTRPQAKTIDATPKGENANTAHQRQNNIPSSERHDKNITHTQNKKVINKPKR